MISTARRRAAPLPDGVRRLARAGWVLMGLGLASVVLLGAGAALALIAYGGEDR